jgi:DDE family transposase
MAAKVKSTYKVTNWRQYNESLVQRGSITFWFDEQVVKEWNHANATPKVGRPFVFSDVAIECMLMLRELFHLPYRQTEGLGRSLAHLMEADIPIPDFTSLAKRASTLNVKIKLVNRRGPIHVVVDSTGLKVFGEGEWKMRQHGKTKRRTWRKLHLVVNAETQEIEAEVLTENSSHDADPVAELLDQIPQPIESFRGDGGYDKWKVYKALAERNVLPIIPPQHNARIKQHGNMTTPPLPRDEAIRGVRKMGRARWKKHVDYHRRSLAETAVSRIKTIFGPELKNRLLPNQRTEARLRCKILNRMTQIGLPLFEWN